MREPIGIQWESGVTIYVAFWCGGQVFHLGNNAFVNFNTSLNAQFALELTGLATSANRKLYEYPDGFDLSRLEKQFVTDVGRVITVSYYLQSGGNPALQSDTLIHEEVLQVQFGFNKPDLQFVVQPNLRADLTPEALQLMATLTANGTPLNLSAVSGNHLLAFELTREGEADPFIDSADTEAAIGSDGRWLLTIDNPGLTSNRGYSGRVHYRRSSGGSNLITREFSFLGCG